VGGSVAALLDDNSIAGSAGATLSIQPRKIVRSRIARNSPWLE
jgi:hypothetical protein